MKKEEFLKKLERNLNSLTPEAKKEELLNYENLSDYNLDATAIANKIYEKRGMNIKVTEEIKFLEAFSIIINSAQNKDKKEMGKIVLFFLYLILLVIFIKMPFIYIRDIITNLFTNIFKNDLSYNIWFLIIEILYAITGIFLFIKLIKKKALEIEKNT